MGRPPAKELTERELEVMHVFWSVGQATAAEIRDQLATSGRDLAYTTVATLIRILSDKSFLEQTNFERPFQFRPARVLKTCRATWSAIWSIGSSAARANSCSSASWKNAS